MPVKRAETDDFLGRLQKSSLFSSVLQTVTGTAGASAKSVA